MRYGGIGIEIRTVRDRDRQGVCTGRQAQKGPSLGPTHLSDRTLGMSRKGLCVPVQVRR